MRYSYRRYKEGDAAAINALYFNVTGRSRTVEQHAWQWLQSPAGESEMWLIEAELEDGSTRLIGHHGVMAEEFSYQGKDIRVGKTENTMVLPDFREKILYPRFEKTFFKSYENKFHALFSTTGPASAIRLREAMGYKFKHEWASLYFGSEPVLSAGLILDRFLPQKNDKKIEILMEAEPCRINELRIEVVNPNLNSFDFDDFWRRTALGYGITPKRTRANLNWRFWSNPYLIHITVKLSSVKLGTCICIVSCLNGYCLVVNDIFTDRPENTPYFLRGLLNWSKRIGFFAFLHTDTIDVNVKIFKSFEKFQNPWIMKLNNVIKGKPAANKMPRIITQTGNNFGLNDETEWYVTPYYFEGR